MATEVLLPTWRRHGLKTFVALALALGASLGHAQGEPSELPVMRWLVQDVPPFMSYPNGRPPQRPADLANGEIDGFMRLLIGQLPQYRHEFVEAGFPRFEAMVRQGQVLCSTLHVRTAERLSWLHFTHLYPPLFSRQLHLVVHIDTLPKLGFTTTTQAASNPIKLQDVLQRADLQGLLPRDRSFGPKIDALLQAQGDKAPKTVVAGRNIHLLAMLRARRMDYTLEYAATVDDYQRGLYLPAELIAVPVAEGRSTQVATVACPRGPEGLKLIEAIDGAVRKLAQDPDRAAWIRTWRGEHLDEQDRQRLKRYMDERARGGPQIE